MAKDLRPGGDHPVSRAVARLHAELDDLNEAPLFALTAEENAATLTAVTALAARVAELELRLAAQAEGNDVAATTGATSTASWWAHATRQDRRAAAGRVRLADALGRFPSVRAALAAGGMNAEQARVITTALDALPEGLEPDLYSKAERHLVAEAAHHDPSALRVIGKHLLTVIAPEIGEAHDARALEREEQAAAARAFLTICPDGRGSMVGKFSVPEAQGQMLHKALLALSAPKHVTATDGAGAYERRPSPERLGSALVELIERFPVDRLPDLGGTNATVVVTMDLDTLLGGLRHASLDTGGVISAAHARRIACEAGIIPAVLGTHGEVLDLGRTTRLFTKAQRTALNQSQPTCTTVGCDWPAYLCHAHHDTPWHSGGPTDLANARNLCPHHHARIHDPTYATERHPDGQVTFHRRT
ncbi:DUF222 domain-containing protein [Nocardioides sp. SYSU DS0663]|uniref:HNH endonuclease signature motif containing protein n=1 Tax=Nocardioides sp. SYSU DS0663 TaxID=3416445 RepID=UPI003F4C2660